MNCQFPSKEIDARCVSGEGSGSEVPSEEVPNTREMLLAMRAEVRRNFKGIGNGIVSSLNRLGSDSANFSDAETRIRNTR